MGLQRELKRFMARQNSKWKERKYLNTTLAIISAPLPRYRPSFLTAWRISGGDWRHNGHKTAMLEKGMVVGAKVGLRGISGKGGTFPANIVIECLADNPFEGSTNCTSIPAVNEAKSLQNRQERERETWHLVSWMSVWHEGESRILLTKQSRIWKPTYKNEHIYSIRIQEYITQKMSG